MKNTILAIIGLVVSQACFAASAPVDLGTSAGYTPYDRYMSPVKNVLTHLSSTEEPAMDKVCKLMSIGRNFRYSFTDPYTAATPAVTAQIHAGDCKAKSLWLADQLGDANVRFVIGRARSSSRISHAWLMLKDQGRWWILDCTNTNRPIPADSINPNREYIPLYSFTKQGSFRHSATTMGVASTASMTSGYTVASR